MPFSQRVLAMWCEGRSGRQRVGLLIALPITLLIALLVPATTVFAQHDAYGQPAPAAAESPVCGTAVNGAALLVQVAASAAATAAEYEALPRPAAWRMAHEPRRDRVIADPSSHLHFLGSYHLARAAVRPTCPSRESGVSAAWRGASIAMAVGVTKEIADGFYNGFSTTDLLVDAAGAGLAVAQTYVPALQHVTPTFSVGPQAFTGPGGVNGAVTAYAHQTLWLSVNAPTVLRVASSRLRQVPLRFSLGRRAFGHGTPSEYAVSVDLDVQRLPGNHPAWRRAKAMLQHVRLPAPAVVFARAGTRATALYW